MQLSGSIPSTIGELTTLTFVHVFVFFVLNDVSLSFLLTRSSFANRNLGSNQLTGPIPSTIGRLTALVSLCVVALSVA
jgi:hypothetical protein